MLNRIILFSILLVLIGSLFCLTENEAKAEEFNIGVGATFIPQGVYNPNAAAKKKDVSYSCDIEIEKEFKSIHGKAFVHIEAGQGDGVDNGLQVFSNVNFDADNDQNARVTELWYEQSMLNGKTLFTFGKLDPTAYFDNNEAANDETTQFLGNIFRNSSVIEFPDNPAGIRLAFTPNNSIEFGYGLLDAYGDWNRSALFNIGQITFKTKFSGLNGNYRALFWHSSAQHTQWLDATKTSESNYGFGLSIDQKITGTAMVFARWGWQNPKVFLNGDDFSLAQAWSLGLQLEGKSWGRENDVLGIALGQAIPSDEYKRADATRTANKEGHFETYYNINVNEHFSISPDLQVIWNPYGNDAAGGTNTVTVFGFRGQVNF